MTTPEYLFEASWEVCNKVGGIYTVLSTKARTLSRQFQDQVIFIGPDRGRMPEDFMEDASLFRDWTAAVASGNEAFGVKTGRWNIPGTPPVILVDYQSCFSERDALYYDLWESFGVDSSRGYGDYDESCIFAYATGLVIRSFYLFHHLEDKKVIAHFNEWMLGMGALYVQKQLPRIATVFTTHATSIGRSIAGNNKPLYSCMNGYNGDQMARELHLEAKHSIEKQTAHHVDCFTTVSDVTAVECRQLLDKAPDVVTPNGFEPDFVPSGNAYASKRLKARNVLLRTAGKLLGYSPDPNAFLLATSGRYEYRNKGIDLFIDSMNHLRQSPGLQRETIAFILVPAWVYAPRADLKAVIEKDIDTTEPLQTPFLTHWLHAMENDRIMNFILSAGFTNRAGEKLKILFVPCYLDGNDGIFNLPYYDLLIGMDATVFPSYYEPWGYTPLESIAFGIPTITTGLAGFGRWAKNVAAGGNAIENGVAVVMRTDDNYAQVVETITDALLALAPPQTAAEMNALQQRCFELAAKAEWEQFISYYYIAYDKAFVKAKGRIDKDTARI
jgi:glycosyltransferase involved in cell wall biosynthesis